MEERDSCLDKATEIPGHPALHRGMENKSSECSEAPKKLGLSFSIEAILKRPVEKDVAMLEGAGGESPGQAAAAGSKLEKQPQGK